jgi:hypothetical protein
MHPYRYPHDEEIAAVGVRGVHLGNYLRWDTKAQHEAMLDLYDYEAVPQTRTFDTYSDIDCWMHSDLHDYIKWAKLGYGRATDHAVRELRFGRLTREQAVDVAKNYEAKPSVNTDLFLEWIGMTKKGFDFILDQNRSKEIWKRHGHYGPWKHTENWINAHLFAASKPDRIKASTDNCSFRIRKSTPICDQEYNFILVGKGEYLNPFNM